MQGNAVRTTKYTWWSFLPKVQPSIRVCLSNVWAGGISLDNTSHLDTEFVIQGLYEQFRRVANFYFLLIAGISLSPVRYITLCTHLELNTHFDSVL